VLLAAGGRASVVRSAVAHALISPLLTDEEGQGLGVLGDVGRGAVAADALEGQGVWIASVLLGNGGIGGELEADELGGYVSGRSLCLMTEECRWAYRAYCGLALAPVCSERAGHIVRVDGVLLLSRGEGEEGARCERGSGEGLHGELRC